MTHDAELATLERLLDDPSPVVRQAVLSKIKAAGLKGVLWLETLTHDESLAAHAKVLLVDLRTPEAAAQSFLTHLRDGQCDLEEACLLLERTTNPALNDDAYAAELDRLATRTRELMAEPLDVRAKCRLLCRVIFGEGHPKPPWYSDFALLNLPARCPSPRPPGRARWPAGTFHGRRLPRTRTALHRLLRRRSLPHAGRSPTPPAR